MSADFGADDRHDAFPMYRLAQDASPDEIAELDPGRRVVYANRALLQALGRSLDQVVGSACVDVFPSLCRDNCPHVEAKPDTPCETELAINGSRRRVSVFKTSTGRVLHIGRLAAKGDAVAVEPPAWSSSGASASGAVLAGVAHELNNPLTVVIAYADLLSQMEETAPFRDEVQQILRNALRCQSVVRNLVAFARDDESDNDTVDVNRLVRDVLPAFAYRMTASGVRLDNRKSPVELTIPGDRDRIQLALVNILNNSHQALASSGSGGNVRVVTRRTANNVEIVVEDDGPGMSAALITEALEPLSKSEPHEPGTALGLKLAHSIAIEHGGRLSISSNPGDGTTVTIILPLIAPAPIAERVPPGLHPACLAGLRVLVVDDEPDVRGLVSTALEMYGASVIIAGNGRDALALIREDPRYDALFTDLRMPDVSGDQLVSILRAEFPALAERVVMTTGDLATPWSNDELRRLGRPYLPKPFNIRDLVRTLAELTGRDTQSAPPQTPRRDRS